MALTFGQQRWIKTLGLGHREVLGDTPAGLGPGRTSVAQPGIERVPDAVSEEIEAEDG